MVDDRCGDTFCPVLLVAHDLVWELLEITSNRLVPSGHIGIVHARAQRYLESLGYHPSSPAEAGSPSG